MRIRFNKMMSNSGNPDFAGKPRNLSMGQPSLERDVEDITNQISEFREIAREEESQKS